MCTAITLQTEQHENFFGRTMDFSYPIEPQLYMVPKGYVWTDTLNLHTFQDSYRFIGIGQESDDMLGFFDGVNEKGVAAAVLYFAGYAAYPSHSNNTKKTPVPSLDFLHYILGKCESVDTLKALLQEIEIIGVPDPVTETVAPLHWVVTDRTGTCVVIEQTTAGLHVHPNPIGVMSNSPDFPWHMTNLRNYMCASPKQRQEIFWGNVPLTPFGQAGGTTSLPGGYTSPERFVRTAFLKSYVPKPKNCTDAVITCFHIMESVTIPKGVVITNRGTYDYTKYTAFINTDTCEYYFKTYDNNQIITVGLDNYYTYDRQLVRIGTLNPMPVEL